MRMRYTTKEYYFIIQDEEHHIINSVEVYVGEGNNFPYSNGRESLKQPANQHRHTRARTQQRIKYKKNQQ